MILILNDRDRCETAAHFLTQAIRSSFPKEDIVSTNVDAFLGHLQTSRVSTIVIPEIMGETNHYPSQLGSRGKQLIHEHVYQKGALYFGLCAGGYNACSNNFYRATSGEVKIRHANDLLALTPYFGKGPIKIHARPMNPNTHQERGHSCVNVAIEFRNANGKIEKGRAWYENGPFFHDNGTDIIDSDSTSVIARYDLHNQKPVAAFKQSVGNGQLLLSGLLSHLHETHFSFDHPLWLTFVHHINQHIVDFKKRNVLQRTL